MSSQEDLSEARAARIDSVFRALDSRPRREILRLLGQAEAGSIQPCCGGGELCGCDVIESLGLSAPTVSHHMKVLQDAGLLASTKRGLWVHYRLVPGALDEALGELAGVAVAGADESVNVIEPRT